MRFGDYQRYQRDLEAGKIIHPPFTDDPKRGTPSRLGANISFGRSRYHLVVGPPGAGKTAFADTNFVLKPYLYWYFHGGPKPYFIYHSMERPSMFKEVKWKAALLYYLDNYILDVPTILGLSNKKRDLTAKDKEMLAKYDGFLADMQSNCLDIKDGAKSPKEIHDYAVSVALQKGTLMEANEKSVIIKGRTVHEFSSYETKAGIKIYYWDSPFGRIYAGETVYQPSDDTFINHLTDHVGKVRGGNEKKGIDEHATNMGELRDLYGFQNIDIIQLNREIWNANRRQKMELTITQADLKGSGVTAENADTIMGVLDPHSFEKAKFRGFNVKAMAAEGAARFRALIVPKNTWGIGSFWLPLFFMGESGWTFELPEDADEQKIASGLWRP